MLMLAALACGALIFVLLFPWREPGSYGGFASVAAALQGEKLAQGDRWTADVVALLRIKVDYRGELAKQLAMTDLELTLEDIYAYKYLVPLVVALVFGLLLIQEPTMLKFLCLLSAPVLFMAPEKVVAARADEYRKEVSKAIPSFLQSLAVLTEAGMNLMPAIEEYATRVQGPLARELGQVITESRMGVPQTEALMRLAGRLEIPELHMVISAIVQGLERGATGIASVCREQAKEVWEKRRDSARELGQKASVKLFIPLFLLVLPTLLLFMLGPAVHSFFTSF